jgi:hypothetical protein
MVVIRESKKSLVTDHLFGGTKLKLKIRNLILILSLGTISACAPVVGILEVGIVDPGGQTVEITTPTPQTTAAVETASPTLGSLQPGPYQAIAGLVYSDLSADETWRINRLGFPEKSIHRLAASLRRMGQSCCWARRRHAIGDLLQVQVNDW